MASNDKQIIHREIIRNQYEVIDAFPKLIKRNLGKKSKSIEQFE